MTRLMLGALVTTLVACSSADRCVECDMAGADFSRVDVSNAGVDLSNASDCPKNLESCSDTCGACSQVGQDCEYFEAEYTCECDHVWHQTFCGNSDLSGTGECGNPDGGYVCN